jgi:GT2 family glycosyltransferase
MSEEPTPPVVEPRDPVASAQQSQQSHTVVAVLVCHNAEQYLPRTLDAIATLAPRPSCVIAVDTGSSDQTPALLASAASATAEPSSAPRVIDRIVTLAADAGYAEAVHAGLEAAPASEWLWLLHDDSAPDPAALGVLLRSAEEQPSVAVWGPKVLGWDEPRRLLEIGVSVSRSGRRFTGLERGEQDQGQYEGQRDVLAVGSAGLLARRDVWSDLGGFERSLRFFREDVDYGWRVNLAGHRVVVATEAVIHHAESMARGRRSASVSDPHATDRASALFTLLANARRATWVLRWLWLLAQTLVRALGFVLGKSPREAAAEMNAVATVLLRPGRILGVRRSRRRWRSVRQSSLRSFFPPPGQQVRHTLETVAGSLTLEADVESGHPSSVLESGPVDDDIDSFVSAGSGRLRRLLKRPGVLLFTGLLVIQLIAWRGLYRGGVLHGGALLPMPTGASDVWQEYLASWHAVTLGSGTMAHPSSAVLGLMAGAALGHATWVVPVILVLGPPLAGVLAYQVTTSFGLSSRLRLAVGAAYALNPVMVAATAQGRWTTVLVAVLLPLAAIACARGLGLGARPPSVRAAAVGVLLLAVMIAVSPPLIAVFAALLVSAFVWVKGRRRMLALFLLVGPAVLLMPWWQTVASDPTVLLLEPGVRLTADTEQPWHALFFDPGGWWSLPWWVGIGLTVAALAAVLRAQQARPVRVALVVAGTGMAWALALEAIAVTPANSAVPAAPWSGSVLMLTIGAVLIAIAVAARGARSRLSEAPFSWRQPAFAVVTALALGGSVVWGIAWLDHGASDPLDRGTANPLPAFVRAQSALPEQIRTLVLEPADGRLAYTVLRSRDARWGDVETAPTAEQMRSMDEVVSDLASGRGVAPVDELTERAVQYILAVAPVDARLEVALDSAPGLLRIADPGEASLWRVEQATGRVRVVESDDRRQVLASEVVGDPSAADVNVEAAATDRVLELAELADDGWRAIETTDDDSRELAAASTSDWAQRFIVGADGADVAMSVENRLRTWLLWGQLALVLALIVVALPGRARQDEEAV